MINKRVDISSLFHERFPFFICIAFIFQNKYTFLKKSITVYTVFFRRVFVLEIYQIFCHRMKNKPSIIKNIKKGDCLLIIFAFSCVISLIIVSRIIIWLESRYSVSKHWKFYFMYLNLKNNRLNMFYKREKLLLLYIQSRPIKDEGKLVILSEFSSRVTFYTFSSFE